MLSPGMFPVSTSIIPSPVVALDVMSPNCDEMPEHRSRMDVSLTGSGNVNMDNLLRIESPEEIVTLE